MGAVAVERAVRVMPQDPPPSAFQALESALRVAEAPWPIEDVLTSIAATVALLAVLYLLLRDETKYWAALLEPKEEEDDE